MPINNKFLWKRQKSPAAVCYKYITNPNT